MGLPALVSERRRSLRAPVHGHATIHGERWAVGGAIENLSLGGARVHLAEPPERTEALEVELRLPNAQLRVTGRALRVDQRETGVRVALRFDPLSSAAEDAIADAVVTSYTMSRRRPVLIVDGIEERRLDLAEALRARRMLPLTPRTPLEAIDAMMGPSPPEVAVVSAHFGDTPGADIAGAITDSFPWVRILYLGKDPLAVVDDIEAMLDEFDEQTWRRRRAS